MKRKTVLITGASSGLGRELALCLAQSQNFKVELVLVARNKSRLFSLKRQIRPYQTPSLSITADISQVSSWKRIFKLSTQKFGKMDLLLLNAGVSMWSPLSEINGNKDIDSLKKIMETNYFGVVHSLHYFLPLLRKNHGRVLLMSSLQGHLALPYHSGYAASKHAVHGFIDAVALEEKDISFHKVILGWVRDTNMRKNRLIDNHPHRGEEKDNKKNKNTLFSASAREVAKTIVQILPTLSKTSAQKENIFIPKILKWALFLKLFSPKILSMLIQKIIRKEFS